MRLTKMFGLAAVAAVAAMAFVGASSASAETWTTICLVHTSLVCPEKENIDLFTFKAVGSTILKTNIATVLCLTSKGALEVEKELLANPLLVKLHELVFLECGTNAEHNNCTVTVEQLPLLIVLKTALNLGTATVNKELPAKIKVECGKLINCAYSEPVEGKSIAVEGALHKEGSGHGMLTANELEVKKTGGLFCPATSKWTALYEPLEHLYLLE